MPRGRHHDRRSWVGSCWLTCHGRGRSWFSMGCDSVLMLSGLLTCCDMFPATRKQPNVIQKKKQHNCVSRILCVVPLWYQPEFMNWLIKGVISKTAYKFRCVWYFQARCYAALYFRARTMSPHFRKVSSVWRQACSLFKCVTTDIVTLNIFYLRSV